MKGLKSVYLILVLLFLYAPIAVMILFSFNADGGRSAFTGFTLEWYAELFAQRTMESRDLIQSMLNSLEVAAVSSVLATVIGTYAALVITRLAPFPRAVTMNVTTIPMLNAEIVTGIGMMMLFTFVGLPLGRWALYIAHTAFNVPYVTLSVLPRLRQLNRSTYEAALDLGAKPSRAFRQVVFPELVPGIVAGALMAFTLSLDDFIISYFTTGPSFPTLSVTINTMTKRAVPLTVNALSTLMFVVAFVLLLVINLKKKPQTAEN